MRELPQDVIEFLAEENRHQTQEIGDIVNPEAAEYWGVSPGVARKRLRELVKEGKLIECKGKLLNGAHGYFYRIVPDDRQPSAGAAPS